MHTPDSFENLLRAQPTKEAFLATCRSYPMPDVVIDYDALGLYGETLAKQTSVNPKKEYLTPGNTLEKDFPELAISSVQQGGYLYAGDDGAVRKWEIDGSGAKALLSKMDKVRNMGALPGIHLPTPELVRERLVDIFDGTPPIYAKKRLDLWAEIARPISSGQLGAVLEAARKAGREKGSAFHFNFQSLKDIATLLPEGMGEDPFLKKATLLPILFAAVAHHKHGPDCVTLDIIAPSDYRDPQTEHNFGGLRYSNQLVAALNSRSLLPQNHPYVLQIRNATVLSIATLEELRPDLQLHEQNQGLWQAGRLFDVPASTLSPEKAELRNQLEMIRHKSGFHKKGFRQTTPFAMNVATLRF